ncbi:MAG: hypothetical protein JWQ27_3029 [Ferruginibacter sp.]|nr:hypothetical protein [Ferruginibacter sp.]
MIIHRITNTAFSKDLSGTGAKMNGARWNSRGTAMLYAAEHISLAVLEMLVHTQFKDFSIELDLLHISVPDTALVKEISAAKMKKNWVEDYEYTRFIGDEFIRSQEALLLKVPSAVILEEANFLVNPSHVDFKKVKIQSIQAFRTDKRLFVI